MDNKDTHQIVLVATAKSLAPFIPHFGEQPGSPLDSSPTRSDGDGHWQSWCPPDSSAELMWNPAQWTHLDALTDESGSVIARLEVAYWDHAFGSDPQAYWTTARAGALVDNGFEILRRGTRRSSAGIAGLDQGDEGTRAVILDACVIDERTVYLLTMTASPALISIGYRAFWDGVLAGDAPYPLSFEPTAIAELFG